MRNKVKIALSEFDRRTRSNPEVMFGVVSVCCVLPFLFLFLFGPLFARYFSPKFLAAYFEPFFIFIVAATVVIGSFFLGRVLNISTGIGRERNSKDKFKSDGSNKIDESEEV